MILWWWAAVLTLIYLGMALRVAWLLLRRGENKTGYLVADVGVPVVIGLLWLPSLIWAARVLLRGNR